MNQKQQLEKAAEKVKLAIIANSEVKRLYGFFEPVLDTKTTLRRVALFYKGTGRYTLKPDERFTALEILDDRFESWKVQNGYNPLTHGA